MASSKQLVLLAAFAAVACLASLASATVFMVGDDLGWRAKFNNTHWADGKTFRVGDSLMFMYPKEKHTVVQVGEDDFAACNLQGNWLGVWDSGDDVVTLDKPGKVWFICSKPNHCLNGMKLAIDVVDDDSAPTPLPFPFPEVPGLPAAPQQSSVCPFPFPFCGPAPAPAPESTSSPRKSPFPIPAPATSPLFRFLFPSWSGSAAASAPASPEAAPPSAAMRNTVGGAVAAVVAAALAF